MSTKTSDVRVCSVQITKIPVKLRVPLKFGTAAVDDISCVRVKMEVENRQGKRAIGWGETPMSAQWVWPSTVPYHERLGAMETFCEDLETAWTEFQEWGHPMELGSRFQWNVLDPQLDQFNKERGGEGMPHLGGLVCNSPFDIALHDAFGVVNEVPTYQTYNAQWMSEDLSAFLQPAADSKVDFKGVFPEQFLIANPPQQLPAWHLVGGLDPLDDSERTGNEPDDGFPVTLEEWIKRDGLKCLKIKLRGNDYAWDYARMIAIGKISIAMGVDWLSTDFNCTVMDPQYVNDMLDQLMKEEPRIYGMILYVEQPFPYDLEAHEIDVHSVSARKPLFMDESAHDWKYVRMGRALGWNGVALKTCKTQTGAILSACWAKAHGIPLMVQDLTNPMLAQIPHCLLAAHVGTIMGVETNAPQFYPTASDKEAVIHPGLYTRKNGIVDLSTLQGPGFGYRIAEMYGKE